MAGEIRYVPRHNSVFDENLHDQYYAEVLDYFERCRVRHLLTLHPVVWIQYVREFWNTATYISAHQLIRAVVNGQQIEFTQNDLRELLQLGAPEMDDERVEFPAAMRRGAVERMGYWDDLDRPISKNKFYGQWRYLAHVLTMCLGARRSGFDQMNVKEISMMLALVYNKPYSFARFFFEAFRDLIRGVHHGRFLMYPRFVTMIVRARIPNLSHAGPQVALSVITPSNFTKCRGNRSGRPYAEIERPLFGHLINADYIAPPNDGWLDGVAGEHVAVGGAAEEVVVGAAAAADIPAQNEPVVEPAVEPAAVNVPEPPVLVPNPFEQLQVVNDALAQAGADPVVVEQVVHDVLQNPPPIVNLHAAAAAAANAVVNVEDDLIGLQVPGGDIPNLENLGGPSDDSDGGESDDSEDSPEQPAQPIRRRRRDSDAQDADYNPHDDVPQVAARITRPRRIRRHYLGFNLFEATHDVEAGSSAAVQSVAVSGSLDEGVLPMQSPLPTTPATSSQQVSPVAPSPPPAEPSCPPQTDLHKLPPGQALPVKVLSPQCGTICVQGYNVKQSFAPILEAIFKKHGDIAAECLFKTASVRSNFLEVVCEVVTRIETDDVIEKMEDVECQVSDAEAANINVSWLRAHLEAVHKRKEAMKKSDLLMETKVNTSLVKRAARMDLRERCEELVTAQERFEKAERCARVLHLVEKNLKNAILESKAENALLLKQRVL